MESNESSTLHTVAPMPYGHRTALVGLGDSLERLHEALAAGLSSWSIPRVGSSLTECLLWIGALDAFGRGNIATYDSLRNAHAPVVGGLAFARNFHAHQLVSTADSLLTFDVRDEGHWFGPIAAVREYDYRFAALADLPPSGQREKHERDLMYAQHVASRSLYAPIGEAHSWLRHLMVCWNPATHRPDVAAT
jgi:hypothetical protein